MQRRRFFALVRRALDDLPHPYCDWLENVDVVVERRPRPHHLRAAGLGSNETLLGLYEGIPLTERASDYGMVLPDKITIFQQPLEEACADDNELIAEVRSTVLHELAHHFGTSDEELERLGLG
ncbi:MAG: metallopeptidase family protein [Dehalococcoidia bacterium]